MKVNIGKKTIFIDDSIKNMEIVGAKTALLGLKNELSGIKNSIFIIDDYVYITDYEIFTLTGDIRVVESRSDEFFNVDKIKLPQRYIKIPLMCCEGLYFTNIGNKTDFIDYVSENIAEIAYFDFKIKDASDLDFFEENQHKVQINNLEISY